ncbi:unnamed protein product [Boreogadus saida]
MEYVHPCRCPVWEKHSIRYPTSSDAPFQSQLLQACPPFLSASSSPVMSAVRTSSSPLVASDRSPAPPGLLLVLLVSSWSPPGPPGPLLVSSWSPPGLLLVSSWSSWSPPGPLLVSWSPPGLLLVSSWSPPGHLLVSSWSPPGLLLVPSWSLPGPLPAPPLTAPDQFWLPVELKETIPQQDQRWIASTLWRNQRLRPDVQLCIEKGQVLISVLTAQEGPGLDRMVSGLTRRYSEAGVAPPILLHVDCGCCEETGGESELKASGTLKMWPFCATPRGRSSGGRVCPGISEALVDGRLTKAQLALYCRGRTRGEEAPVRQVEALLLELMGDRGRDLLGVPLLDRGRMEHIWRVQKRHVLHPGPARCASVHKDRHHLHHQGGELIGIDYLYLQTGKCMQDMDPEGRRRSSCWRTWPTRQRMRASQTTPRLVWRSSLPSFLCGV